MKDEQNKKDEQKALVGEVIISEDPGGEPGSTRKLRVYDRRGDFVIEIPSDAKVTFGYFNPGVQSGGGGRGHFGGGMVDQGSVARATALRIWRSENQQLAVFLGVDGFRDLTIPKTSLRQRVTIETNFEDDGDGVQEQSRRQVAIPRVVPEDVDFIEVGDSDPAL